MTSYSRSRRGPESQDPPDWVDGAPTSPDNQSCAFCGTTHVAWVHPLDSSKTSYRAWNKGWTLPTFWAVCEDCESKYQAGEDDALVQVMSAAEADHVSDLDEDVRKPVAVFRRADRGGRRFHAPLD